MLFHTHRCIDYAARKTIFSFCRRPEKMVFPKESCWNMIFLVLWGKMIFFFPKIWSCLLDGKWKMIFLKKYTEIYFLQMFWKDGLFKRDCAGTWSFLYYLERWYFFPENMIFFPREESERWSFSGNTWKKKVKDDPAKIHQKVIDALDWHSRKSSSSSL